MISIVIGWTLDIIFGRISWLPDPAAGIRWLIKKSQGPLTEQVKDMRAAGIIFACAVMGAVYFSARMILWDFGLLHPAFKTFAAGVLIYSALSAKKIAQQAADISGAVKKNNMSKARKALYGLIRRDTDCLDAEQISAEAVEVIARGTLEGVIGVLFYAFLGGAPLAWVYKSITLMSQTSQERNPRQQQLGWFSGKLERIASFIPLRLAWVLIPAASFFCRNNAILSAKAAARYSSLMPQAAFAGALGIQLGGLSYYKGMPVYKPHIFDKGSRPKSGHINEAVRIMYVTSALMLFILMALNYFWKIY